MPLVDNAYSGSLANNVPDTVEFRFGEVVTVQNKSDVDLLFTIDGTAPVAGNGRTYEVVARSFRSMRFPANTKTLRIVGPPAGTWAYTADTEQNS